MDPKQENAPAPTLEEGVKALIAKVGYNTHTAKDEDGRRYRFEASKLCGWWDRWRAGKEQSRWTEKDLYALKQGGYLVATAHLSQWQGELTTYAIERYEKISDIEHQGLLDELRSEIVSETGLKVPLSEIAVDLE